MNHTMTAVTAAVVLLGSVGCGPSVRDLVARRAWTEAVERSGSRDDIQIVQSALRSRVTGRLVVRVYSPEESAALLGWLPGQLRDRTVSLVAFHADLASPDATITTIALEPAPTAETVACCENQLAWETLDYRGPRTTPTPTDDASGWMTTARHLLSLIATPIQTAIGVLRDAATLSTAGAVGNTPITGPGVDLSVGALLAHLGLHTSDPQPAESAAARAAAEAQSRARLHALLATECAAESPSCIRYALWKPIASISQLLVTYRYVFEPASPYLSDQLRFDIPPSGRDLVERLQRLFPSGPRPISELPQVHMDEATSEWVPGPPPPH